MFGKVQYFSIDSLSGLSAVDLDSNKVINLMGRAQDRYPYDSNSTDYDTNFKADFAFSFGNLDPSCGGQLFLTYFPSYHVPDLNKIDTAILIKRQKINIVDESFGPFYEIDNYYSSEYGGFPSVPPNDPVNEFYLIQTNEKHFALLRIKALLSTCFYTSLLCYIKNAIKMEWWIQDDGNYNQLSQAVEILDKNANKSRQNLLIYYNKKVEFNLMGRKCLNPISSNINIIKCQNNTFRINNNSFHLYGYQK